MKKHAIYIIFASMLFSCEDFVKNEEVIGRYHLVATDTNDDLTLSYKLKNGDYIGVVGETVFAVGFNNSYIIIKQHPSNNKAIINYYIVTIYKENNLSPEKGVIGPLSKEQFEEKRKELSIPDTVTFTKEIEDLK